MFKNFIQKINILKNMIKDHSVVRQNKDIIVLSTEDYDEFLKAKSNASSSKIVAAHSGSFHADDVLSCTMAKYIEQFRGFWIVRSRNMKILKEADMVVDVGGIFDPETNRFDHHMKEFNHTFDDVLKIKMSSAGLVYKYHGKEVIKNILLALALNENDEKNIDLIFQKVYINFIAYVDANDNGVNAYQGVALYPNTTSYASRIGRMNPEWNEPDMDQSTQFKLAMDLAEEELVCQIRSVAKSFIPAYEIVKKAIDNRFDVHKSGSVICLDTCCPWKEHLCEIEKAMNIEGQIKFVLYKDTNEGYRIQTVPLSQGSFQFRHGIHSDWRGLDREKLKEVCKIDDVVFVHSSGFIGGARSYDSALKMAELSLQHNS